jgi:hypothetical protein
MKRKELKLLDDKEMVNQFIWAAESCVPEKLIDMDQKKNDYRNIQRIVTYKNNVENYITCIKELKSRGFTLQEIMSMR